VAYLHAALVLWSPWTGLRQDGLFRKAGSSRRVSDLQVRSRTDTMHFFPPALLTLFFNHSYGQLRHQALFDSRPAKMDLVEFSVHDVAAVLKRYIRELPQPIFTARLQSMFFSALGKGREQFSLRKSEYTSHCVV